jgi:hypothetical protein
MKYWRWNTWAFILHATWTTLDAGLVIVEQSNQRLDPAMTLVMASVSEKRLTCKAERYTTRYDVVKTEFWRCDAFEVDWKAQKETEYEK